MTTASEIGLGIHGNGERKRDLDIVLCHQMADFDSLGCAIGLAKLRGPETLVVCPGGEHPMVRRFLALHRQLFEIVPAKVIDPQRLRWIGVVDTQRKDRLGVASDWPSMADEVVVFDHHEGTKCDIENDKSFKLVVDNVGALATLITERIVEANLPISPAEATLLGLAIHADTGSLTYEQSTPRDGKMLAWLMANGAVQRSIAEFSHSCLTEVQQRLLSEGLNTMARRSIQGCEVGSVFLSGSNFLKGMSTVAQDLLELSNVDALLLCYISCLTRAQQKNGNNSLDDVKHISIIGRARARVNGVDFTETFRALGGGGHARAASISMRGSEKDARRMIDHLTEAITKQIPQAILVQDIMQREVHTLSPTSKMHEAKEIMTRFSISGLPIVDFQNKVVGIIASQDVRLAEKKNGNRGLDLMVTAWMHHKVISALPDIPVHIAERLMTNNAVGRLPIVNKSGEILGIVTRTDILIHRGLWSA